MPKQKQSLKPVPKFRSEAEERRFWEAHDSAKYVDWSKARFARFPKLKPSTETISLRLPAALLADLKALANRQDVPYQSLLKVFLADRVNAEWRADGARGARPNESARTAKVRRGGKPDVMRKAKARSRMSK